MNTKRITTALGWMGVVAVVFGLGTAAGQQTAPKETKGVLPAPAGSVDLTAFNSGLQGYQLRSRTITVAPGGVVGIHSHKERPGLAYIVEGKLTEYREGGYVKEYAKGQTMVETLDVTHWVVNSGKEPVIMYGIDIFK